MSKVFSIIMVGLLLFALNGCISEREENAATGYACVDCGKDATRLAGTGFIESTNSQGTLYLCENCYNERINWAIENNRLATNIW